MADGINTDKVIVNAGGSGDGGGGSMAAVIAALGNRNQGNDNAALIAALGNRNDNQLGPLMAMLGNNNRDRDGMGEMWPLLLLLLGRGRGGFGGGDDCCDDGHRDVSPAHAALLQTMTENLSDLRAQVPTTALQSQNAIQGAIAQLALADQQGFAGVKDAVQSLALFQSNQLNNINQNVSDQGCKTRELVQSTSTAVLQRMDDLRIRELEHDRDRAERAIEVNSLRSQVEITNTNTATATQAQGQFQSQLQFQDINNKIDRLCGSINIANQTMLARQGQDIVNLGTMTASGTQAAANTQVR